MSWPRKKPSLVFSSVTSQIWKLSKLYPEIEAAYLEDRVDDSIIDLHFVQDKLKLPTTPLPKLREDGLYLRLRCKACERAREHFVQHVMVETDTQSKKAAGRVVKYDPYIVDREIVCPKCGARDQYELTPEASLRLIAPDTGLEAFTALFRGDKTDLKPHPRVSYFKSYVFGRPMHPLAGLARYKKLITAKPNDADLRVRMGMLLRTLHRYPEALESLRKGHELQPDNPDHAITYAMAEHDFGDRDLARTLYERTIDLASQLSGR